MIAHGSLATSQDYISHFQTLDSNLQFDTSLRELNDRSWHSETLKEAWMKVKLPKVADYMTKRLHTLAPDNDIYDAVAFFIDHSISGAPVIENGQLVGILSERDCLGLLAKGADHAAPEGTVRDFMVSEVVTVPADVNIYHVAGMFLQMPYRRFPVVEDGALVGQISRRDVLKAIQERFADRHMP